MICFVAYFSIYLYPTFCLPPYSPRYTFTTMFTPTITSVYTLHILLPYFRNSKYLINKQRYICISLQVSTLHVSISVIKKSSHIFIISMNQNQILEPQLAKKRTLEQLKQLLKSQLIKRCLNLNYMSHNASLPLHFSTPPPPQSIQIIPTSQK